MVAVAETQSFTRAAERCNVTQPTLSNAIAKLEQQLGATLFKRSTRSVEMTAFGRYILPRIKDVLDSEHALLEAAKAFTHPQHKLLRIGFSPLVDMHRLDQALTPYRQAHPEVSVFFKECFLDDLDQRLEDNQIDISIVPETGVAAHRERQPFYSDPWCYLSPDHQVANKAVACSELPTTPVILTGGGCGLNAAVEKLLREQGGHLETYPGQAISYPVIEEWVSLGVGAGILPASKLSSQRVAPTALVDGSGKNVELSYYWYWLQQTPQPEHISAFVDHIRNTVPALMEGQSLDRKFT